MYSAVQTIEDKVKLWAKYPLWIQNGIRRGLTNKLLIDEMEARIVRIEKLLTQLDEKTKCAYTQIQAIQDTAAVLR